MCRAATRESSYCATRLVSIRRRKVLGRDVQRVAKLGFKAAAVRPCFWNGRYPTLAEFDPLWREFEATGVVLAMHTFPSRIERFSLAGRVVLVTGATRGLGLEIARGQDRAGKQPPLVGGAVQAARAHRGLAGHELGLA